MQCKNTWENIIYGKNVNPHLFFDNSNTGAIEEQARLTRVGTVQLQWHSLLGGRQDP